MSTMDASPPCFSFGNEKRQRVLKKDLDFMNVGPASYSPSRTLTNFANAPMFSMGGKFAHGGCLSAKNLQTPDPTRYSPNPEY